MIQLRPHQIEAIARANEQPFLILNHALRSGKSITALEFARQANYKSLVITHPNLLGHWENEINKVGGVVTLIPWTKLDSITQNPQKWQLENKIDGFIIDEAHLFKNPSSKRSKALLKLIIAVSPKFTLLLTGTPFKEGRHISIYNLLNILGHPLAVDYWRFVERFSDKEDTRRNKNTPELLKAIRPYIHTFKYPKKETELTYIRKTSWSPPTPTTTAEWLEVLKEESLNKIPVSVEMVVESEASHQVVFTWFIDTSEKLQNAFKIRGINSYLSTGSDTPKKRVATIKKWKSEGGVLVGTIAANCEGLDLSEGEVLIMHDLCFEETKNSQALKRCDSYNVACDSKYAIGASWVSDVIYHAFQNKVELNPMNIAKVGAELRHQLG